MSGQHARLGRDKMTSWQKSRWAGPAMITLALAAAFHLSMVTSAQAETDGLGIASRLPVEVLEVVSGGSWSEGTASGSYRTVTVQSAGNADSAEVYLQWIGSRTAASPLQIISSLPLREFNAQKLGSASVNLETEEEGVARISISAQDGSGKTSTVMFVARLPGQYEPTGSPAPIGRLP